MVAILWLQALLRGRVQGLVHTLHQEKKKNRKKVLKPREDKAVLMLKMLATSCLLHIRVKTEHGSWCKMILPGRDSNPLVPAPICWFRSITTHAYKIYLPVIQAKPPNYDTACIDCHIFYFPRGNLVTLHMYRSMQCGFNFVTEHKTKGQQKWREAIEKYFHVVASTLPRQQNLISWFQIAAHQS